MSEVRLWQAHARCKRDPLAVELSLDKRPEFHEVSEPMSREEAHRLAEDWQSMVKNPDWVFTVEPAEEPTNA